MSSTILPSGEALGTVSLLSKLAGTVEGGSGENAAGVHG